MSPEKGPIRVDRKNWAARMPPIIKRDPSEEALRKPLSNVPLRRRPGPTPRVTEEPLHVDRAAVEQAITAAEQGNTIDVRAEGCELTLRVAPALRDALAASGLEPGQLKGFFQRMAKAVGSKEAFSQLPPMDGMPDLRVYRTALAWPRAGVGYSFRVVLTLLPDSSAVLAVSCAYRRDRLD